MQSWAHMNLRAYRDDDLDAVVRLFTASVHGLGGSHYDAAQLAAWAPRFPDMRVWPQRLAGVDTTVAEAAGELLGFIAFEPDGHIDFLYTAPAHARRGVAAALYQQAEARLAALGISELFTEASLVALPFFERHGFRVLQEEIVTRAGVQLRRFAMRKSLSAPQPAKRGSS